VLRLSLWPGVVVHTFNPSTWEAEAGGFLSLRPAWSTE
jgi:major histocompatibility complex class I